MAVARSSKLLGLSIRQSQDGNDFAYCGLPGAFDKVAFGAQLDSLRMFCSHIGIEDVHIRESFCWNTLIIRKHCAGCGDELRPNTPNSIYQWIVTFVKEVGSDVLERQRFPSAFAFAQKPVANTEVWSGASLISV
ncbi:hypothetical protein [Paucibacter sp. KBW04]|uniref:hypothetical protein n=1 Tax=Paucibacter sp. KBW04 TaxID=2153361 RepID=UPI0012DF439B|nr:hypothetical protein [Paucibacter sp. KBW04]